MRRTTMTAFWAGLLGIGVIAVAMAGMAPAPAALAQAHPGEAIYKQKCAACHDNTEATRAPPKASLSKMRFQLINYALTVGNMKTQGAGLNDEQRGQLINYLIGAAAEPDDRWIEAMMCPAPRRTVDLSGPATVTTFGFDKSNTRVLTARQAGLTKAQLSNMELAWAMAFPASVNMRSQPAVVGDNLFYPVAEMGMMFAIDVGGDKPCIQWAYKSQGFAPFRSSAGYGVLADGRQAVVVAGQDNVIHLVDAKTGKAIWTKQVGVYRFSQATGTPVILRDRVIVPMSQYEIVVAANNAEKCCDNHGYVLSLDPRTGEQQWRYDTMEDAKPLRDRGDGKMLWGPSGAPIWTSPAIDEKRGLIYLGTGEANSPPAHRNTDAIIAIGLKDGKERWSMQATANDIYNSGCGPRPRPDQYNCVSDTVYRDVDFGSSMMLGKLKNGKEVVFGGQKSGTVWALDPDTGKLIFRTDIGTGGALGGIHWGTAIDNDVVYAPIAVVGRSIPGVAEVSPDLKPGLYAVDANTGKIKWVNQAAADCSGDRRTRVPNCQTAIGYSGATTIIDGTAIQGSLDGFLRVIDTTNGKELWRFDTANTFPTVNGVPGKGGAIDNASIVAAKGQLFVNSGYARFGQAPGNVLLAFRPKAR